VPLNPYFLSLQKFNPQVFLLLAAPGHIVGASSSIFAASIEGDIKQPARSIGDHLRSQNFCPRARKIRTVLDTHKDIIGFDAPVKSRILPDHNEYDPFKGHEKEDVTNKVSDPLFTNLIQRSDNNEKPMLIK